MSAELEKIWKEWADELGACACGRPLMFSARERGDGRCGPCHRGLSFRTIAVADRVNHDPGDEDRP